MSYNPCINQYYDPPSSGENTPDITNDYDTYDPSLTTSKEFKIKSLASIDEVLEHYNDDYVLIIKKDINFREDRLPNLFLRNIIIDVNPIDILKTIEQENEKDKFIFKPTYMSRKLNMIVKAIDLTNIVKLKVLI